tara:strand:+ start:37 stop:291 length:255 start_codon:yes stop_codon:yes gene_type:complete
MAKVRNISDGASAQGAADNDLGFDLSSAKDVKCSNCGCKVFEPAFMFKKISALLSPTGQESMLPIQTFRCSECGNIEDDFLPKE